MIKPSTFLGVILLIVLAFTFGACAKPGAAPLEDTTWILKSYGEQGNLLTVLEGTEITATFDSAEKRVSGSAGCNSYFGDYQLNDNTLTFLVIGHTEMYCMEPEGAMEQETQYLKTLNSAESYQVKDGTLQVNSGDEILIYTAK